MNINSYIAQKKSEFIYNRLGVFKRVDDVTDEKIVKLLLLNDDFVLEKNEVVIEINITLEFARYCCYVLTLRNNKDLVDHVYKVNKGFDIDVVYKEWVDSLKEKKLISLQPIMCSFDMIK